MLNYHFNFWGQQIGDQVAKNLHNDPQLWRLSDAAVASLGCWPFAEQAKEVSRQGEVKQHNWHLELG